MPFCEFRIKAYAYKRMQGGEVEAHEDDSVLFGCWATLDPKKLPKTIDEFMRIGEQAKEEQGIR